jgi:hypothetical protein
MKEIDTALAANRDAVEQLIRAGEQSGAAWNTPCAPGKWSPSQIVEPLQREMGQLLGAPPSRRFDGSLLIVKGRSPQLTAPSQPQEQSTEEV